MRGITDMKHRFETNLSCNYLKIKDFYAYEQPNYIMYCFFIFYAAVCIDLL